MELNTGGYVAAKAGSELPGSRPEDGAGHLTVWRRVAPALGISAYYAVAFAAGHAIWSISVPIALVETLVPRRKTVVHRGWYRGLTVSTVLFLLGAAAVFRWAWKTEQFLPSEPQMITAAAVVVALIVAAFVVGNSAQSEHPLSGAEPEAGWRGGVRRVEPVPSCHEARAG